MSEVKPEVYEIPDDEFEYLQRDPDATIYTGLSSGEGAVELHLYYHTDPLGRMVTYVVGCGEFMNSMPWKFANRVTPQQARDEYVEDIGKSNG